MTNRVLIVVFDALRPDMVSDALMPNLSGFARSGSCFVRSRCVFPSETRVNQSSLVTGCYPGRHGIVANQFVELTASPQTLFNTGNEDQLRLGDERLDGQLLLQPSLGEYLAEHQKILATLSSGTPGGGRILHHRAAQLGGFRLAMHRPDATVPAQAMAQIESRIGPIPKPNIPSGEWLEWATSAWLEYIETDVRWDVGIIWLCEPDNSYHYCGIGSPENLDAIRKADQQFARLLDHYHQQIEAGQLQVIALSDHGQLGVVGAAADIAGVLQGSGLRVGPVPGPSADVAVSIDSAGGIFCLDHNRDTVRRVVDCLHNQPWCALLATRHRSDSPHGITLEDLRLQGPRAPDVAVVLQSSDDAGPYGWPGTSRHDAAYPVGGGIHGGLHPLELNNWLAMGGQAFRSGLVSHSPVGIVDILPTVLHLTVPDNAHRSVPDGRVLVEALADNGPQVDLLADAESVCIGSGAVRLQATHVRGPSGAKPSYYLDGLVESP